MSFPDDLFSHSDNHYMRDWRRMSMRLGKLTRSVCTLCPPCNPTGSDASWWCHRLAAQLRPRWLLAEPLERHPDAEREGGVKILKIWVLKGCVYATWNPCKLRSSIDRNEAFSQLSVPSTVLVFPPAGKCWWSFPSYCPGSHFPEPACGSGRTNRGNVHTIKLESMQNQCGMLSVQQAKSGGVLIRLPSECKGKKLKREFWQAQCPEVFHLS